MKLELWYPTKPAHINQGFGANPQYYAKFGIQGHNGIDFTASHGQPVYAAHDGMAYYEVDSNQGDGFVIRTNEPVEFNDGTTTYAKTIYWHLCSANDPQFKPLIPCDGLGHAVKCGDLIGYADNTGAPYESTGDHLHFGLKAQAQGEDNGIWYNIEQTNGFAGALDPTPYFNGKYAQDYKAVEQTLETTTQVVQGVSQSNLPDTEKQDFFSKVVAFLKSILNYLK